MKDVSHDASGRDLQKGSVMRNNDQWIGGTHESSVWKDKGPPGYLERHATTSTNIFPQCADTDKEEPHG